MAIRKIKPKSHKALMDAPKDLDEQKVLPKFRIELPFLPEAKNWKIGNEYLILLRVKQTGVSMSRFQNDAEFDIVGIDPDPRNNNPVKTAEKKDKEE